MASRPSKWFSIVAEACLWLGALTICALGALTFADVLGRYVFKSPVTGTIEIVEFGMTAFSGLGIAYATFASTHIVVDVLVNRFSPRTRVALQRVGLAVGIAVWAVLAYKCGEMLQYEIRRGLSTPTLDLPTWPFTAVFVAGLVLCCIACARQIARDDPGEPLSFPAAADEDWASKV